MKLCLIIRRAMFNGVAYELKIFFSNNKVYETIVLSQMKKTKDEDSGSPNAIKIIAHLK